MHVNGQIKISDYDDINNMEPDCAMVGENGENGQSGCKFDLDCVGGKCVGYNAMSNMDNARKKLLPALLRCKAGCGGLEEEVRKLNENVLDRFAQRHQKHME